MGKPDILKRLLFQFQLFRNLNKKNVTSIFLVHKTRYLWKKLNVGHIIYLDNNKWRLCIRKKTEKKINTHFFFSENKIYPILIPTFWGRKTRREN